MQSFSLLVLLLTSGLLGNAQSIGIIGNSQPQAPATTPSPFSTSTLLSTSSLVATSTTTNKKVCKPKTTSSLATCQVTSTIFQTQSGFATCAPIYSTVTAYPTQLNATYTLATSFVTATVTDTIYSTITSLDTILQTQVASLTTLIDKNFTSVITIPQTITEVETVLETEVASLTTIIEQNLTSVVTLSQPFPVTIPINATSFITDIQTSVFVLTSTSVVTVTQTALANNSLTSLITTGPTQTISTNSATTTSSTSTTPTCAAFALRITNGSDIGTYIGQGYSTLVGGASLQQAAAFQISSGSHWLYYKGNPVTVFAQSDPQMLLYGGPPSGSMSPLVCSMSVSGATVCQAGGNTIFGIEDDNSNLGIYDQGQLTPGSPEQQDQDIPNAQAVGLVAQCLVTSDSPTAPAPPPASPSCAYTFLNYNGPSNFYTAVIRNSTLNFVDYQNTGAIFSYNNVTSQFANGNYPLSAIRGSLSPVYANTPSYGYYEPLTCAIDANNQDTTTCEIEQGDSLVINSNGVLEIATPAELQNDGLGNNQPISASIRAICATLIESGSTPGATAAATTTAASSVPTSTNPANCQYINLFASNGVEPGSYVSPNGDTLMLAGNSTYAAAFSLDSNGLMSFGGYPVTALSSGTGEVILYEAADGYYSQLTCSINSATNAITCNSGSENVFSTGPQSSTLYLSNQGDLSNNGNTEVTLIAECASPPSISSLCPSFSLEGFGNYVPGYSLALDQNYYLIDAAPRAGVYYRPSFSLDSASGNLVDTSNGYRAYITSGQSSNIQFANPANPPSQASLLTCTIAFFPETVAGGIFTCTSSNSNQNVFSAFDDPNSNTAGNSNNPYSIFFAQDSLLHSQGMSRVNLVAACITP